MEAGAKAAADAMSVATMADLNIVDFVTSRLSCVEIKANNIPNSGTTQQARGARPMDGLQITSLRMWRWYNELNCKDRTGESLLHRPSVGPKEEECALGLWPTAGKNELGMRNSKRQLHGSMRW